MRFEVPQFVDVEDKIIGPFTWKQFVYLAGGAGVMFVCYATLPFFLFLFVGTPFLLFSLGLAFYRVNNRPLSYMIEAVVTYFGKTRLYIWKRESQIFTAYNEEPLVAPAPYTQANIGAKNNISSLARKLEINALNK